MSQLWTVYVWIKLKYHSQNAFLITPLFLQVYFSMENEFLYLFFTIQLFLCGQRTKQTKLKETQTKFKMPTPIY